MVIYFQNELLCFYDLYLDMGSVTADAFMEMGYEQRCQSEVVRQTKGLKVLGMAVSPVCEKRIGMGFLCYLNASYICADYHTASAIFEHLVELCMSYLYPFLLSAASVLYRHIYFPLMLFTHNVYPSYICCLFDMYIQCKESVPQ